MHLVQHDQTHLREKTGTGVLAAARPTRDAVKALRRRENDVALLQLLNTVRPVLPGELVDRQTERVAEPRFPLLSQASGTSVVGMVSMDASMY